MRDETHTSTRRRDFVSVAMFDCDDGIRAGNAARCGVCVGWKVAP